MEITRLNALSEAEAEAAFLLCCGAGRWATALAAARPFAGRAALLAAAEAAWPLLTDDDWREAFTHHPQIGDIESLRTQFADTRAWAGGEQSGSQTASEETLRALAAENAAYREKFGYIFIICATGRSADEMLAALRVRLFNAPEVELSLAAEEQKKITRLRLDKLLGAAPPPAVPPQL